MVGAPCSGKSTWIQNNLEAIQKKHDANVIIISQDTIRESHFGKKYKQNWKDEKEVTKTFYAQFQRAVLLEKAVIILDNCHMNVGNIYQIMEILRPMRLEHYAKFYIKIVRQTYQKAFWRNIWRRLKTGKWIPIKVLKDFYQRYDKLDSDQLFNIIKKAPLMSSNKYTGQIFLTSDTHFGHANIASEKTSQWKIGYRIFDSIEEMDSNIIDNINKLVPHDAILFHLGDFSFGGHYKIPDYRRRIACQTIHFIRGNHDQNIDKYADYFTSISDKWEGSLNNQPFALCHYAMRIWLGSHKGHYHAYGHSHSSLEHTIYGRSMDVGIDNAYRLTGEYRPFRLEEVVRILQSRQPTIIDNHGKDTNVR